MELTRLEPVCIEEPLKKIAKTWSNFLGSSSNLLNGAGRGRTGYLQIANLSLYQVSYSPKKCPHYKSF